MGCCVGAPLGCPLGGRVGCPVGFRQVGYCSGLEGDENCGSMISSAFVSGHKEDGIKPPKLLRCMLNDFSAMVNFPISLGIVPVRELKSIERNLQNDSDPKDGGILPTKQFIPALN